MGGASRWWLHHSLTDLSMAFERIGSKLTIKKGNAIEILSAMVKRQAQARSIPKQEASPGQKRSSRH